MSFRQIVRLSKPNNPTYLAGWIYICKNSKINIQYKGIISRIYYLQSKYIPVKTVSAQLVKQSTDQSANGAVV